MTLNETGKKMKRAIVKYLKEIKEYKRIEEAIIIDSTAFQWQKYDEFMQLSELNMAEDPSMGLKLLSAAQKFYVNYTTNLKTLGISAIQRKKLNHEQEEEVKDDSIFTAISNFKD